MTSSKCGVNGCKRDFDTICAHCQSNVCSKHYIEHVKLANDELPTLSDQLNYLVNLLQQQNPIYRASEELEQWREMSYRQIDKLYNEKKRQLKAEVEQNLDKQMSKLRELSQQVRELIAEGDASFKAIENVKRNINECQKQCKKFEKTDYAPLKLDPIENLNNKELFTGHGTLLTFRQQVKLNEFYGKENQKWMLAYKATKHGFESDHFHRFCDHLGPTITVIQSNVGDYLFGGYASVSWRSIRGYVEDRDGAFLFTLTNPHGIPPTKYPIRDGRYATYSDKDYGPIFGSGHDLCVCDNSGTRTDSSFNFPHSYIDTTNRGSITFTGHRKFQINDIEVYCLVNN